MGTMIDTDNDKMIECPDTGVKQPSNKCEACKHCQGVWFDQSGKILEQIECDV